MHSTVGFIGGDKNQAVDDLDKQERGGSIKGRSFIPMNPARISKNKSKSVRKANRITNIRAIDKIRNRRSFHRVINRVGVGGHVIYKKVLFEIKRINRGKIKLLPLFSFQKGRSAKVKATHFMKRSTLSSAKLMPKFFNIEGKKQIKRLMK